MKRELKMKSKYTIKVDAKHNREKTRAQFKVKHSDILNYGNIEDYVFYLESCGFTDIKIN